MRAFGAGPQADRESGSCALATRFARCARQSPRHDPATRVGLAVVDVDPGAQASRLEQLDPLAEIVRAGGVLRVEAFERVEHPESPGIENRVELTAHRIRVAPGRSQSRIGVRGRRAHRVRGRLRRAEARRRCPADRGGPVRTRGPADLASGSRRRRASLRKDGGGERCPCSCRRHRRPRPNVPRRRRACS